LHLADVFWQELAYFQFFCGAAGYVAPGDLIPETRAFGQPDAT
jgi:hypothetical protein